MKAYLLLENGLKIEGDLFGKNENVLGTLTLSGENLVLKTLSGQSHCVLTQGSASVKTGESAFFAKDASGLKACIKSGQSQLAKLVLDTLDVKYHLYDLKTFIPGTVKVTSDSAKKAAA